MKNEAPIPQSAREVRYVNPRAKRANRFGG